MSKKPFLSIVLVCCAALSFGQQTSKGMSLNGITGLITTPTAQIGWEDGSDIGIDAGYHWIHGENQLNSDKSYNTHIPKLALSLFEKAEIAVAYDTMNNWRNPDTDPYSVLFNGKFQFYKEGSSAVAIGGNIQMIQDMPGVSYLNPLNGLWYRDKKDYTAGQLYLVATYAGTFFTMPAATSITFGKTFAKKELGVKSSDIDFSMGFELTLFPAVFKNYIQWINDFSNYSYSAGITPSGSITERRGSYNTGLRIDPLKRQDVKLVIDAVLADVFDDDDRAFILGLTFGTSLK
jgi:hypothetical protein